jgi:hypothetical protein
MRRRQRLGLAAGATAGLAVTALLALPGQERLHAHGPMNTGHEALVCTSCHRPAPGTMRQQLQANTRWALGMRSHPADFGLQAVDNPACLRCHDRPNDRHPVFRFVEPRFAAARRAIAPHRCVSCHREHNGRRLTVEPGYCVNCHSELSMSKDPLDVPHATLVERGDWLSCLGCHDFHGNHEMKTPTRLSEALPAQRIAEYFAGAPSPYPGEVVYAARTEADLAAAEAAEAAARSAREEAR